MTKHVLAHIETCIKDVGQNPTSVVTNLRKCAANVCVLYKKVHSKKDAGLQSLIQMAQEHVRDKLN